MPKITTIKSYTKRESIPDTLAAMICSRVSRPSPIYRLSATAAVLIILVSVFGCNSSKSDASAGERTFSNASTRGADARSLPFVASVNSEAYHVRTCEWAKKISDDNLVGYTTKEACRG